MGRTRSFAAARQAGRSRELSEQVDSESAGTANCNINAKIVLNFLLKMQKEWRIAPEKTMILFLEMAIYFAI